MTVHHSSPVDTLTEELAVEDSGCARWEEVAPAYESLIENRALDSAYLREVGLERTLLDIVGPCEHLRVLDAGCGTGWLFERLRPREAHECDIVPRTDGPKRLARFRQEDCRNMSYEDSLFDLVVASLLLMWFEEVDVACREFYRITAPGGRLIVTLTHPYFYRTGEIDTDGSFRLTRDLSRPERLNNYKIAAEEGPLPYHYRPVSFYHNTLVEAGWNVKQMREWFIDMEDYRRNATGSTTRIPRTGKVPLYLFLVCQRER